MSEKKGKSYKVEQIYTDCLAEAAYYIQSEGEVAIIDPLRDVDQYIEKAEENGDKIKYIFETHFHADFVSGHVDLAKKTGATIVYGPGAETNYSTHVAQDGEQFKIGNITIQVLHTPGHTLESSTFLLKDEAQSNQAIFTGDTLFIGDVGRPDLAIKSDLTKSDLAGMLFQSLRTKIMPLEDDIIVYPAHGAGSACGKNMSKETYDSLGHQKMVNYALRADMTKEQFVDEVLTGIAAPPQYFAKNAMLNKVGYQELDKIMQKGLKALDVEAFNEIIQQEKALILDVRDQKEFVQGFIPGALFIGLGGTFAPWVGALIEDLNQPIVLITEEGKEQEAVKRLSRVGYDNTLGYLKGGVESWKEGGNKLDTIRSISAEQFSEEAERSTILDVRKPKEFEAEHIVDAQNLPLDYLKEDYTRLDQEQHFYIHCAGGYRSVIASSILKSKGYHNITDVKGGFDSIRQTNMKLTNFECQSTTV